MVGGTSCECKLKDRKEKKKKKEGVSESLKSEI